MLDPEPPQSGKLWQAIVWTLRITVAFQCLGNWYVLSIIGESTLLSWMISPQDVGGHHWNEATGIAVHQTLGWLALVACPFILLRPCAAVLLPLGALQLLLTLAMCHMGYNYTLQADWLSPDLAAYFPLASQSARIATPISLLLLDPWRTKRPLSKRRIRFGFSFLLAGSALAFLTHGLEAWDLHPPFIDLLISSTNNVFGASLSQSSAEAILLVIGIVDIIVAIACLFPHMRGVLWWMAFWGGLTAISRITCFGWEQGWHAAATRVPHLGAPLAVVLFWHLVRCNSSDLLPSDNQD